MGYTINAITLTKIFVFLGWLALLIMAIILLFTNYICDSGNCNIFNNAEDEFTIDTVGYNEYLLNDLGNDGIWPVPYIIAAIATPISLWLLNCPFTAINFFILFALIFFSGYISFNFVIHHYINPVLERISRFMIQSCTDRIN